MLTLWHIHRGRRPHHRIAVFALIAYLGVLLQPCAMAMGHEFKQGRVSCHDELTVVSADQCLMQSMAECGVGPPNVDIRDFSVGKSDALICGAIPPLSFLPEPLTGLASTSSPGPRTGPPALYIRYCVFLK